MPVVLSFTVETDGRLPDGTSLRDAVAQTEAAAAPDGLSAEEEARLRTLLEE